MLYKKIGILIFTLLSLMAVNTAQATEDYLTTGQAYMFEGTISGLRMAYDTFERGMQDPVYPKSRELLFLHSVTRTAMLVFRADGGDVNSFQELAGTFGLEIMGDSLDPEFLELYYPRNERDRYEIPEGAPDGDGVKDLLNNWLAVEAGLIIDNLDQIYNTPEDKFVIYFEPAQTGMESTLAVGYGEVLVLKSILTAIRSHITAMPAYDLTVDNFDEIIQKIYADSFSVNDDLMGVNPNFFKLLPTENDPTIGKDALAQASADMIDAINLWIEAIEYIKSESINTPEPGVERFLYIEASDLGIVDSVLANLAKLRDSILNDTTGVYDLETAKIYNLYSPAFESGQLTLLYDMFNESTGEGTLEISGIDIPYLWEIADAYSYFDNPQNLTLILENITFYPWGTCWNSGYMDIYFNSDMTEITNAYFSYWGCSTGTIENIQGAFGYTQANEDMEFDANPIYGSSVRYPDPLSPQDMLPEFDQWNRPLPGTVAKGAGYDATLGGVLPGTTQKDWQMMGDLQPAGLVMIQELYPYQYGSYSSNEAYRSQSMNGSFIGFWFDEQVIFQDINDDVACDSTGNLDINCLYMGYYLYDLYGEIVFNDTADWNSPRAYEIILSYSPEVERIDGTLKIVIEVDEYGYINSQVYQWRSYSEESYWGMAETYCEAYATEQGLQFRIGTYSFPFLPGRFVTVNSYDRTNWMYEEADENSTHLRVGPLGTAQGSVKFAGSQDQPVFIEAYTDPYSPDESIVSSTMIFGTGEFTLEGIGLGWKGYVRAFTPVFGFENPFEINCFPLQDIVEMNQWKPAVTGLALNVGQPQMLEMGVPVTNDVPQDRYRQHVFSFEAVKGEFYNLRIDMYGIYGVNFILYGIDGDTQLLDEYPMNQDIPWQCIVGGTYFIELIMPEYIYDPSANYTISINTGDAFYQADIAGPQGIGVKDGRVDQYDLGALATYWLQTYYEIDIDKTDRIDLRDFAILADEWLSGVVLY